MITLDSNKIEVPIDVLRRFNEDDSDVFHDTRKNKGEAISDKFSISGIAPGLNYIEVNQKKQSVIVATSAKILGDDYLRGISINTIEQVVNQVNSLGTRFIELDPEIFIQEGRFLSVDTTNNVVLKSDTRYTLDALHAYKVNSNYKCDYHQEKTNQGIVFQGRQKTFKERLILYDKLVELTKKPENREFMRSLNNPTRLLKDCENVLRTEQNSVQLRKIRERLNIGSTNVLDVLQSPVNPNYNLALKIVKGSYQLTLFDELKDFESFHAFEKWKGQQTIIRECGYDISLIEQIMKHFYSGGTNYSRQKREYQERMYSMMEEERIKKDSQPGLVDEFLELLRAC